MATVYSAQHLKWSGNDLCHRGRKVTGIVPDERYPKMWRIERPDGTLTDMVNLTRAKDAAMTIALRHLNARVDEAA